MRHLQLTIATIHLEARPIPLRHGTIQIVERDHGIDWEVQLFSIQDEPIAQQTHGLAIEAISGVSDEGKLDIATLTGRAFFVRGDDKVLVFRGDGALDGFDLSLLEGQP